MDARRDLEFRLLGTLEAVSPSGEQVRFTNRKVAQLAAILALRPGQRRDRSWIASAVWPTSGLDTGLASLRNALASLKRDLAHVCDPDVVVQADRTQICLSAEHVVSDTGRFHESLVQSKRTKDSDERLDRLEQALEIYTGPFLPEVDALWAETERAQLDVAAQEALGHLVEGLIAKGLADRAAEVALRAVSIDPDNEVKLQWALRALSLTARGSEAVALYRKFERGLRERLGVSPAPATIALAREAKVRSKALKEAPQSNIPRVLPTFFGRKEILDELVQTVVPGANDGRVVTLIGTGGLGKTRLALEAARAVSDHFHGAVWLVELAPVTEPEDVVAHVVHALLPGADAPPESATLARFLGGRPCLMILDNLEQVEVGLGAVVTEMLESCPGLQILATSREPVGVAGEVVRRLEPLPVPTNPERALDSPSVALYLDRARQAAPQFEASDPAVLAELVRKLEGLPLAICLAAAQADILTPEQTLQQLQDRFGLLATEDPGWPERHRRLWACIDWSYRLHPEAQGLLKRLSFFRGGWTRQAAQWASPDPSVHAQLQTLVRSALAFERSRKGQVRFEMFESVREFVQANMTPEETVEARECQAAAVAAWVADSKTKAQSFNSGYIEARAAEYENLREAFHWSLQHDPDLAIEICNSLAYYWWSREMGREGSEWLQAALKAVEEKPGEQLAMAYRALSTMHIAVTEYEEGLAALDKGLSLLPGDIDPVQRARYVNSTGNALMRMERFEEALGHFRRGMELCEQAGNVEIFTSIKGNSGFALYLMGELDEAERVISEVVEALEGGDNNDWLGNFVHNLGLVAKARGDYSLAEARFDRARKVVEGAGLDPAVRSWLNDSAVVSLRQGKLDKALSYIRQSAGGIGQAKGAEQHAECIAAAAEFCEAVGNDDEAVALWAAVLRTGAPPQRSRADKSPTPEERFQALQDKLRADRFRSAAARYKGFLARDVLEEIEDLAMPSAARQA